MLKIKLARFGKRNQPHFRIVINEAKDKRDGSYIEMIGHYIPAIEPKVLEIDLSRYDFWIEKGAQPTDTVEFLAKIARSGKGFPSKKKKPSKKAKKADKTEAKQDSDKEMAKVKTEQKAGEKTEKKDQAKDQESAKTEKKTASAEKTEKKVKEKQQTKK